jgi:hypothetical protein
MRKRLILIFSVLGTPVVAADKVTAGLPDGITCEQVRATVAQIGRLKAMALAIEHGATFQQIRAGRKCMNEVVASNRGNAIRHE